MKRSNVVFLGLSSFCSHDVTMVTTSISYWEIHDPYSVFFLEMCFDTHLTDPSFPSHVNWQTPSPITFHSLFDSHWVKFFFSFRKIPSAKNALEKNCYCVMQRNCSRKYYKIIKQIMIMKSYKFFDTDLANIFYWVFQKIWIKNLTSLKKN